MTGPERPSPLPDRKETARRKILDLLLAGPLSARQISSLAGISEKEVVGHVPHLRKTARRLGRRMTVTPAECRSCGFSFRKRERADRPSRCPVCRGESISPPLFAIAPDRT